MRVLLTGINGFAGSHLAELLLSRRNVELYGVVHEPGLADSPDKRPILLHGDLTDADFADHALDQSRPEQIYHLAGRSFPPDSRKDPWGAFEANARAALNLLEGLARRNSTARLLLVGSMEEYGRVRREELPVAENTPLRPTNAYGVSKVAQDLLGQQYHLANALNVVRARPANHIGPRQNEKFVAAAFARQIARIEAGLAEPTLRVGNLAAERDFCDVRDMARAYILALEKGQPGEAYNIGSGRARPIRELLDILLSLSQAQIKIATDPAKLRPAETPVIYCSAEKFRRQTGWQPLIPLEQSLRDTLDFWRAQTTREAKK